MSPSAYDLKQAKALKIRLVDCISHFAETQVVLNPEALAMAAVQAAAVAVHSMDGKSSDNAEWALSQFRKYMAQLEKEIPT